MEKCCIACEIKFTDGYQCDAHFWHIENVLETNARVSLAIRQRDHKITFSDCVKGVIVGGCDRLRYDRLIVTIPFLFLPCGCCAPGYTDTYFSFPFLLVMLTDAMRSSDVSSSRDCGHCLIMCHRFAYSLFFVMLTVSRLCFLPVPVMSTRLLSWTLLHPYVCWTTRLSSRPGSSCAQSSTWRFVSCSLTRLDAILVLYFYEFYASLYLYLLSEYI